MRMKTYLSYFFLFISMSTFAQWTVVNQINYNGDFDIAGTLSKANDARFIVQVEKRSNIGTIGLQGKLFNIGVDAHSGIDYKDYGITFKFDDDPKVYYSTFTNMLIQDEFFWIVVSDGFGTDTKIKGIDNPKIGVLESSLYKENMGMIFEGKGWLSQLEHFIDKLKEATTMYLAVWIYSEVYYYEFSLKGSSAAIDKVFNPSYKSSMPIQSTKVNKILTNDVLKESSRNE